jgi:hypothetical protein
MCQKFQFNNKKGKLKGNEELDYCDDDDDDKRRQCHYNLTTTLS